MDIQDELKQIREALSALKVAPVVEKAEVKVEEKKGPTNEELMTKINELQAELKTVKEEKSKSKLISEAPKAKHIKGLKEIKITETGGFLEAEAVWDIEEYQNAYR